MTTPPAETTPDSKLDLAHATRTEFINAMVHLYRGELGEATAWRTRIDATSNWAVVLSVTALSFVFGGGNGERHVLIPIVVVFCTFLLMMEARRYRFYDIWRTRARTIEINFYRPMLDGSQPAQPDFSNLPPGVAASLARLAGVKLPDGAAADPQKEKDGKVPPAA